MLSVIVPVGPDRWDNFELLLHGLSLQTYGDFELIAVANSWPGPEESQICRMAMGFFHSTIACHTNGDPVGLTGRNRNIGAKLAHGSHLIFLDSDVVLERHALEYYAQDFEAFPERAIAGMYHWLPPMVVTPDDLSNRWGTFIDGNLPPAGEAEHNVGRDARIPAIGRTGPERLFCDYPRCLALLTGNLGVSRRVFEHVGGFWEELEFGVDGAFGMALVEAGFSFSFDTHIIGGHLHHARRPDLEAGSRRSLEKIKARFHSDNSWLGKSFQPGCWPWD